MKSFKTKKYIHSDKEDNWDLECKAEKKGFSNTRKLSYLGYEVSFEVEIFDDCTNKVLKINGVDVSSLNIKL